MLIMRRRVLAFTSMDQGHANRCEEGSGLGVLELVVCGGRELGMSAIWWQCAEDKN